MYSEIMTKGAWYIYIYYPQISPVYLSLSVYRSNYKTDGLNADGR